jgi:hypothetical protein
MEGEGRGREQERGKKKGRRRKEEGGGTHEQGKGGEEGRRKGSKSREGVVVTRSNPFFVDDLITGKINETKHGNDVQNSISHASKRGKRHRY